MERLGENSWSESVAEGYKPSSIDRRISKAIEEEEAFIEYIMSLPAMSSGNVETFKKKQASVPATSTPEFAGGLEHLENLYKLMEHLGQLRKQNCKLQKRVKYLENIAQEELLEGECEDSSGLEARRKRSSKCKSGYGIRHSLIRSSRERSRSVGVEEIVKSRQLEGIKSKVSKWSKVKEAFRWEKVLLPDVASQDSGIGGGEYLRVPSDQSSFSVSPADSVLSGPQPLSSTSSSEDELELDTLPNSEAGYNRCTSSVDSGSQMRLENEVQDTRRSKSLDGNAIVGQNFMIDQQTSSKEYKSNQYHKPYKTPWSKVKDIIQTRTGSIKKKRSESDFDEDVVVEEHSGSEDNKDYEEKLNNSNVHCNQTEETDGTFFSNSGEMFIKKKLAPALTITLPSTEELRTHETKLGAFEGSSKSAKPPASPQSEEKYSKCLVKQRTLEETSQIDTFKKQVSSSSAGTSPPTPRRQSKWTKVKNAFLTSSSSADDILNQVSNSVPSSPVKFTSFIYDIESDDLSSGEFIDDNIRDNNDDVFPDSMEESFSAHCEISTESIHNEIKRNFEELQLRLSHEFHEKLTEWERLKNSGISSGILSGTGKVGSSGMSSGTSSIGEDDKIFRKKMEEWDKIKSPKQREVTLQQLGEENLSPDFRKKLEQWEKLKSIPLSPPPESSSNTQPQLKKKITEWQRWRSGGSCSKVENLNQNSISDFPDDFPRKLQEWEKMKQGTNENDNPVLRLEDRSPSPSMSRKDCMEQKPKKLQQPLSETGHKVTKVKSNSEVKELAWLEKELHKIEREKIRLERERDKYLEREARLEKMRKALGSTQLKQEVLIPTSTGLFRFQGISQKFTRKLYEWEKARGIGPEASTFALLDPGYQPPSQPRQSSEGMKKSGALLLRSKSVGSVVDVASNGSSGGITHQPSSLSLNNMENIESSELTRGSDPEISQGDFCASDNEEPEAVIVDVEDVVEETASPLIEQPAIVGEIPVYCYAPDEVTHLIDSSGSDNEISGGDGVQSSYIILQENINLINKLQKKEDICRKIEYEMENLEEKMQNTALNKEKHLENLERVEPKLKENAELPVEIPVNEEKELQEIKAQLVLLEQHQEELRHEEKTLKYSFVEHSEQQAVLAQNLVDKMRQLQEVNSSISSNDPDLQQKVALGKVQDLTFQLLSMAERLEVVLGERSKEIWRIRNVISSDKIPHNHSALSHHSFSTDSITTCSGGLSRLSRESSEELSKLPALLTSKILELKRGLSHLCAVSDLSSISEGQNMHVDEKLFALVCENRHKRSHENCTVHDNASELLSQLDQSKLLQNQIDNSLNNCKMYERGENNEVPNDFSSNSFTYSHNSKKDFNFCEPENSREPGDTLNKNINSVNETTSLKIDEINYTLNSFKNDLLRKESSVSSEVYFKQQEAVTQNVSLGTKEDDNESTSSETVVKKLKRSKRATFCEKSSEVELSETDNNNEKLRDEQMLISDDEEYGSNKKLSIRNSNNDKSNESEFVPENLLYDNGQSCENIDSVHSHLGTVSERNMNKFCEGTIDISREYQNIENGKGHKTFSQQMNSLAKQVDNVGIPDDSCSKYTSKYEKTCSDKVMTVNVFVPTTRKIFSPVRRDSKGKASSVISYVVKESFPNDETCGSVMQDKSNDSKEADLEKKTTVTSPNSYAIDQSEGSVDKRGEIHFIMPPCWILRETRAQSASPALQRRHFPCSKRRGSQTETHDILTDRNEFENESSDIRNDDEVPQNIASCSGKFCKRDHKLNISKTPPLPRKEKSFNKENLSTESSSENSNPLDSKLPAVVSNRKSRTDVGFPPISPIPGRREIKFSNKETAPSIKMMIARYNRKISESQEFIGTKSPDSGSASPVAWRSPGTERRVRAQMEKYQEEIRKVVQGSSEIKRHITGEVKKSASASFIRSLDKCGLQDGFNRRPSDGLQDRMQNIKYRGILKSSSAGSIKSCSPILQKKVIGNSGEGTGLMLADSTVNRNDHVRPSLGSASSTVVEETSKQENIATIYPQSSPESSRLRAIRIKKAKEEFLLRGPGGGSWSCDYNLTKEDAASPGEGIVQLTRNRGRLSQISCDSDCSYEGILVSGEEQRQDFDTRLLVKSASAGMINIDSAALTNILPESPSNSSVPSGSTEIGTMSKSSRFGLSQLTSRFRKVRMRRHKDKDKENTGKMETVSALCRQSLLIDLQRNRSNDRREAGPSSKSCPSSPVLQKRDSTTSWLMKRHKIFKPK